MDAAEIVTERLARDFGQRARQFDAGRPAADDDERQQALLRLRIGLALGGFERQEHPPPDLQRIVERLETGREGRPFRMAEIRVRRARRHDQVVVSERLTIGDDDFRRGIDGSRIGQQHLDVLLVSENPADRRRDVAGRQRGRGHLIQQGLKDVVVVAVEERDADRSARERPRRVESAETSADDDDMGVHGSTVHGSGSGSRVLRVQARAPKFNPEPGTVNREPGTVNLEP